MVDNGGTVMEADPVAGVHDMGDKPAQSGVLVTAVGTVGILNTSQRPQPSPVRHTSAGDGEDNSTDGVGEDVGLSGQVRAAAAVLEAPLQPVIPSAVGPDGHGRGEKGADGVARAVLSQRGEIAGLNPVAGPEQQDPGSGAQRPEDLGQRPRVGAAERNDPGLRQVLSKRVERVLTTCGTDDDDVHGLGAAGVHKVGISISWGGPQ